MNVSETIFAGDSLTSMLSLRRPLTSHSRKIAYRWDKVLKSVELHQLFWLPSQLQPADLLTKPGADWTATRSRFFQEGGHLALSRRQWLLMSPTDSRVDKNIDLSFIPFSLRKPPLSPNLLALFRECEERLQAGVRDEAGEGSVGHQTPDTVPVPDQTESQIINVSQTESQTVNAKQTESQNNMFSPHLPSRSLGHRQQSAGPGSEGYHHHTASSSAAVTAPRRGGSGLPRHQPTHLPPPSPAHTALVGREGEQTRWQPLADLPRHQAGSHRVTW